MLSLMAPRPKQLHESENTLTRCTDAHGANLMRVVNRTLIHSVYSAHTNRQHNKPTTTQTQVTARTNLAAMPYHGLPHLLPTDTCESHDAVELTALQPKTEACNHKPEPGSGCFTLSTRRVYCGPLRSFTLPAVQPEVHVQPIHPASTNSMRRARMLASSPSTLGAERHRSALQPLRRAEVLKHADRAAVAGRQDHLRVPAICQLRSSAGCKQAFQANTCRYTQERALSKAFPNVPHAALVITAPRNLTLSAG